MNTFSELYQEILAAPVITIYGHGQPDGDCYGCAIGLREILRDNFPEKEVYALGAGLSKFEQRLAPMDVVPDEKVAGSLGILVDVSCLRRCDDARVFTCAKHIKFDHHNLNLAGEPFAGKMFVDSDCIAAAEILADFAFEMGLKVSRLAAEALYVGMLTDSGRFSYYGTTKHTFEVVYRLAQSGIEFRSLIDIAFREEPNVKAFKRFMAEKAELRGNVTYLHLQQKDYEPYGLSYEQASSYVNAIAGAHPCHSYVYFCDNPYNDEIRVELRSNQLYPVVGVATAFGGGGHLFAAGCELKKNEPEKIFELIEAMNQIKKYNI